MKQNQKSCTKTKKVIDRWKRSKTIIDVKPVVNISKNLQSFLEKSRAELLKEKDTKLLKE